MKALRRGDYDRALLWLGPAGCFWPRYRGLVLALAGRSEEAEAIFRKRADAASNPKARAWELGVLADILVGQQRYDEARDKYDQALKLNAGDHVARHGLARLLLEQGIEPERALELVERTLDVLERAVIHPALKLATTCLAAGIEPEKALDPVVLPSVYAYRLATKAWALARLDGRDEAEEAIAKSLELADRENIPGLAMLHWTVGMACAAMGETAEAREHFQTAAQLDPNGANGKRAARYLAAL